MVAAEEEGGPTTGQRNSEQQARDYGRERQDAHASHQHRGDGCKLSDPKIALGFIEHLTGKVQEQEQIIVEQGGRLKKLDRIEAAGGSMCLTDAAKTLKVRPQELIRFMQSRGFIYKRVGNTAWIGRQEKIQSGYLEHREHVYLDKEGYERVATQVLVTAKGLVKLSELLEQPPH